MAKNEIRFKILFTATKLLAYIVIFAAILLSLFKVETEIVVAFVWAGVALSGVIAAADRFKSLSNTKEEVKETPTNEL